MKRQVGQVVILLLLVVCLTAGIWAYMRWNNYNAEESLNENINHLNSSLERKDQLYREVESEKGALIRELAKSNDHFSSETNRFLVEQQTLREELAGVTARFNEQKHSLSSLSESLEAKDQFIDRLQQQLTEKSTGIGTLLQDKQALSADIASMTAQLANGNAEVVALAQERDDIASQVNTLENQLKELNQYSEQLNEEYIDVKSQLASETERSNNYNEKIDVLNQMITTLQQQVVEQRSGIDALLEEKKTLTADIQSMTTQLTTGNAEVVELAQERDGIDSQVKALENQLNQLNQYSKQLNQQYVDVQGQLASEIKRSQDYSEKIETLEEQYIREQAALAALEKEINQYREDNKLLQASNSSLLNNNQQLDVEKSQLIQQYENGISVIRLPNRILFDTGSAQLSHQGQETLVLVARTLKEFPGHLISVEGHTDHRPIGSVLANRYPSNWELSSARAASAIRILVDENIPAKQFQVVGFADTRPLTDKSKLDQLNQNRRIEILLFPPVERKQKMINLPQ